MSAKRIWFIIIRPPCQFDFGGDTSGKDGILSSKRIVWIAGLVLTASTVAVFFLFRPHRLPAPDNVILIVVDALRADHLGCYGYERSTTPNIDAMAEKSLLCSRAYSQSNWTCPSMASLFSGTYPLVHMVYNRPEQIKKSISVLPEDLIIIPEALQPVLRTAAVTSIGWVSPETNYDGFDEFFHEDRDDATIMARARRWITAHREERFFLYLHLVEMHDYYWLRESRGNLRFMKPAYALSETMKELQGLKPSAISRFFHSELPAETFCQDDIDYLIDRYDSLLFNTDRVIGKLIQTLDSLALRDRTLVIITADHGERFYEQGRLFHGGDELDEEVVRIPLLLHGPPLFEERKVIDEPVESIDIYPTLLDLLRMDRVKVHGLDQLQGNSLFSPDRRKIVLIENSSRDRLKAVHADWSYIVRFEERTRHLFDLGTDPAENVDISSRFPQVVRMMDKLIEKKLKRSRELNRALLSETVEADEKTLETLRALGYIK